MVKQQVSVGGNSRLDTANILQWPSAKWGWGGLWAAKWPVNSQDPYAGHRHHFGHMYNHVLGPFLGLLNHCLYLCFESSSKLAELDRGQVRGKVSGLAPDYSISQGCCEGRGATGKSTMATLVVRGPHARGQLAELCSSNLDLIKAFSLN